MLVLSRKPGESLVIGDNVRVYVSRILGNRVTLAIEAPQEVHVVRGELQILLDDDEFAHQRTDREGKLSSARA